MKLYHGTNASFEHIDLSRSRLGKDFGAGFYLTPDAKVAQRQSERKFEQGGEGAPMVMEFLWDESNPAGLKILRFESYSLEWAEFVLANRNNKTRQQLHDYDVVVGPIADDTVGFQIRRYEDGVINMQQFLQEIKYNHITIQYFFATEKAIATLRKQ